MGAAHAANGHLASTHRACTAAAAHRLPAHLNPAVREVLLPPLVGLGNVVITDPLSYSDFSQSLNRSTLVLTDSGGVQEEAPSLGKPVLVMRETTERPEAVEAGTVRLVGTDSDLIFEEVMGLLTNRRAYERMARAINPYGDGRAARRSVAAIEYFFGLGTRPDNFVPSLTMDGASGRATCELVGSYAIGDLADPKWPPCFGGQAFFSRRSGRAGV